jgi:hypothetical protein
MPWQERWELRTAPFGCNCSTTSFLVSVGTVAGTIVALILLYLLVKLIKYINIVLKARNGGWELHVTEDGQRWGHVWIRRRENVFAYLWRRMSGKKTVYEEDRVDDEQRPLLG